MLSLFCLDVREVVHKGVGRIQGLTYFLSVKHWQYWRIEKWGERIQFMSPCSRNDTNCSEILICFKEALLKLKITFCSEQSTISSYYQTIGKENLWFRSFIKHPQGSDKDWISDHNYIYVNVHCTGVMLTITDWNVVFIIMEWLGILKRRYNRS